MDAITQTTTVSLSEGQIRAIENAASKNFDLLELFIGKLLILHGAAPTEPILLKVKSIRGVAIGLHLLLWEINGYFFHRQAGLPSAEQIIQVATGFADTPEIEEDELWRQMLRLTVEKFAWHAPDECNCDIALSELPDDQVLDALATFLWESRGTAKQHE